MYKVFQSIFLSLSLFILGQFSTSFKILVAKSSWILKWLQWPDFQQMYSVIGTSWVAQKWRICLPSRKWRDVDSILGLGRSLGRGNGNPLLPGKFHGQRSLAGYRLRGLWKSQTQLSDWASTHIWCDQGINLCYIKPLIFWTCLSL